ncbi:MAG: histone deacetylase [Leptospira sp.]|nr:histone deacetylase [Leptospira sp.]
MITSLALLDEFWEHDTGSGHPENKNRLTSIKGKLEKTGYFRNLLRPEIIPASDEQISAIHDPDYIKEFRQIVQNGEGFFDMDTPYSSKSFLAATLAAGSGISISDSIIRGDAKNGMAIVRPPGHHAEKSHAMGFCLFNNIAITAKYLQNRGFKKILILDWDVHHGNGTEHSFYDDDSVYFISIHQYPFYPGTGHSDDRGDGKGKGFNLNLPMPRGSDDADYLNLFDKFILPETDKFHPDFILISAGFDAHERDPLGGMDLSTHAFEKFTVIMKKKAEELCQGRIISFLEGGYDLHALADSVEAHLAVLSG